MTGYILGHGLCIGCRRPFGFNPMRVPSIIVNGQREPVCRTCIEIANPIRRRNGLPEFVPLPDAYEACEEGELG